MQLIIPEVLSEARGLSVGAAAFFALLGLMLWAYGWKWHRFWVVFGVTLSAGVMGLSAGHSAGGQQVLVVGVLMAVAAGMLALEVAKVTAFVTGGTVAWIAFQLVLPQAQELWAAFLSGGLLGGVLFRLWTMLATSAIGALIAGHAALVLVETSGKVDAATWAGAHSAALNGVILAAAIVGVIVQARTSAGELIEAAGGHHDTHGGHDGKDKNPKKAEPAAEHHHAEEKADKHEGHGGHGHDAKPGGWKRFLPIPKFS